MRSIMSQNVKEYQWFNFPKQAHCTTNSTFCAIQIYYQFLRIRIRAKQTEKFLMLLRFFL